jgi:hypothetical protein
MIEVLPSSDTVVALRVSGRVDENDIERAIQVIEAALVREERIALYSELEISSITPGALARDLRYGLGMLRELHRFARAAVVTSQSWVRGIAQIEARIFPQLEIRVFTPEERDEALAWASQPIQPVRAEPVSPPSVDLIETTSPNVIAFEVNGRIRSEDMRRLITASDKALSAHERLRVLVRVVNFDGVSLDALREDGLASIKIRGWKQVERYALVGGPAWMQTVAGWSAPLVRTETRHFDRDQEDQAWRWLEAEPRAESMM